MKKLLALLALFATLTACGSAEPAETAAYHQIDPETAKEMMDENAEAIILDVRNPDEYAEGHIPNAVLLPVTEITEETAAEVIPAKDSTVLVYCRSGNRSKIASEALSELGYSAIYEFGGIGDWPYDVVTA